VRTAVLPRPTVCKHGGLANSSVAGLLAEVEVAFFPDVIPCITSGSNPLPAT
jgi:hypothetical protein